MIRVQQALEKLGHLWRLPNIGLGSYGNFEPLKTSNYSKTPHMKPIQMLFDHYSVTSAFPGCVIFPKQDFIQHISPSKFRSCCKHQRIIISVQEQHVSHQHSSTAEKRALRHCQSLGTTLLPSLLLQTVLIFERAKLISHFILSSSNEQNSYMAGMLSSTAYYSTLKSHSFLSFLSLVNGLLLSLLNSGSCPAAERQE